jgi:hypothetical protein
MRELVMGFRTSVAVTLVSMALLGAPALAQRPNTVPPDTCTAKAAPPPSMAAWSTPSPLPAARSEADLPKARLQIGKAVQASFAPVADVKFRVPPEKADGPATYGGLYALTITEQGVYRIAASAAPWMDVFDGTTPAKSARFGHGPACTGIGKMVEFPLQPGTYLVQFSESLQPTTEILVVKTGPGDQPPQR